MAIKAALREPWEGRFVCVGLLLLPWLFCVCIVEDIVSMAYRHGLLLHHRVHSDSFYELILHYAKPLLLYSH